MGNRAYTAIILRDSVSNGEENCSDRFLKHAMLVQLHSGDMKNNGKFIDVPLDFHKGPFMNPEDEYTIIIEASIRGNCNHEMIKTIGNTEVTYGMKAYAEGVRWNNGLICYNKNNLIVRNGDNTYGQPGFLTGCFYYDRLGVEILERYLVPELIHKANRSEFTIMTDPATVRSFITDRYREIRQTLLDRLNKPDMTEELLFSDAPIREEINGPIDDDRLRIIEFERKIAALEAK